MRSDDELITYLATWQRSLVRLQRAHPARWRVPGLSEEEVRDTLTLRLLEAALGEPRAALPETAEVLSLLRRQLTALRKSFRLAAVPTAFDDALLPSREEGDEARWIQREDDACRSEAAALASASLSTPQRRWLAAFELTAQGGAFFESSAEPNLSAAARMLGRHRSSAQRAYQELQTRFQLELRRID